jgi:nitrite reductase (NO-forming)/hydroxylamine reductase
MSQNSGRSLAGPGIDDSQHHFQDDKSVEERTMRTPAFTGQLRLVISAIGFGLACVVTSACAQDADVHAAEVAKGSATGAEPSEAAYQANCAACHQANGQGLRGAFPPLAGNERVVADPMRIISVVLNGIDGELEVDGVTYMGVMPPMGHMTDEDIAGAVNHILSSWGNEG